MGKGYTVFVGLIICLLFSAHPASATGEPPPAITPTTISPEATNAISIEAQAKTTVEATSINTSEAIVSSPEATGASTVETTPITTIETIAAPTIETKAIIAPIIIAPIMIPTPEAQKTLEEGASYKNVPWGCDFNKFREIKAYPGGLGLQSAGFVNSFDDNDIALILGAPVSEKSGKGERRIMYEFVPQKFATVYFEPDDVYYIFYNGKFAMAFSGIIVSNFDLYRDNFYKKYRKTGTFSKQFELAPKKNFKLEAIKFQKGKTVAFLMKSETEQKKNITSSAKVLFVSEDLFAAIRQEVKDKLAAENQTKNIKARQGLEKDLKKIE